ncbi:hypothetical protein RHGRI_023035 [Rhododendron griersonianum]|uniref:Protein kinase domain-containing protein n=1 Tax=Rhododendron griersonianum TaxID=479676 RepID=A0AAV6J7A8_9ERIC|nr:hypothetical protein RHGRI_023035 [Rhododendron griersonianum]
MGCFPVLKNKKKKYEQTTYIKHVNAQEHSPTTLPEPHIQTRTLKSAPPSFRTRAKPTQPIHKITNSRTRTLSAPSSLSAAEQDALSAIECEEQQQESKSTIGLGKEHRSPSPQPLPLPSPQTQSSSVLKTMGSFKSATSSGPLNGSGPLPLPPFGTLRYFSYEELSAACHNFSPERCMSEGLSCMIYRASLGDDNSSSKKLEATVTRIQAYTQGLREFLNEVNTLASLQHPNLCKLIGFHARDGSEQRMLVYERLYHGSLDRLLYGRSDGPTVDWNARKKVAFFLRFCGMLSWYLQAMFNEFSNANIQIDKDFSAKFIGYGCINHIPETEIRNSSVALANVSVETLERGVLTPKSNVWCFGIVLLELLTGRKNLDSRHPKEEMNLCIASTTMDEYRTHFEKDKALARRFQLVLINEPSQDDAFRILLGLREKYESHHKCKYTLEALKAAVHLSAMYIPNRHLPDKAIDLIDEAGSKARMESFKKKREGQTSILSNSPDDYWQEIRVVQVMHEVVIRSKKNEDNDASTIEEDDRKLPDTSFPDTFDDDEPMVVVGPGEIAAVASIWSGIPVQKLTADERMFLVGLDEQLKKRVLGQDEAVAAICRAVKRSRVGLKNPKRPIATMLFCGPTGVGKTELAKALAACHFGSEAAMVRLDMSEYMEQHTVSKLIGSAPAVAAAVLWGGAVARSFLSSCTSELISMSLCLNYITGNSSEPSSSCCQQLASVVKSQLQCLCAALNGGESSMGINVNQTQALALHAACSVTTPPALQQKEKFMIKFKRVALWKRLHERNAKHVLSSMIELEGFWGPKEVICHGFNRVQPDLLIVGSWGLSPFQRCFGPCSCPSKRATWARELVDEEAEQFLKHSFIDPDFQRPWLAQRMALKIPYSA